MGEALPGINSADDTIAAVATPAGQGAVSLIRLSGSAALAILARVFFPSGNGAVHGLADRRATLGQVRDGKGEVVDEVLATVFRGPRSYTGEDVVEISSHGGILVTQRVLEAMLAAGARPANPGEFSQRAFLNGKMDLTQAEAVMDLISAQTELGLRAAREQLAGRLGEKMMELRAALLSLVANIEAHIDFPDEDIDPATGVALAERMRSAREAVNGLLATADRGRILREGARVVICGAPNVGKSSLLNLLLGYDRAIVSDMAGTTRDTLEEVINLRGIPLRLVDTAGVRASDDELEIEGMQRTRQQVEKADLVLWMVDGSLPHPEGKPSKGFDGARQLLILNKSDLGLHPDWQSVEGVGISCAEEQGIGDLEDAVVKILSAGGEAWGNNLVAINSRHKDCLGRALKDLQAAEKGLSQGGEAVSPEIVAIELRSALDHIGEIVGQVDSEEILGEIFSNFCIGK